jgi:hypothetical protein
MEQMAWSAKIKFALVPLLILSLAFSGCVRYRPQISDRSSFMDRAQTQTQGDATVTLTVLSNKEAKKFFGTSLSKRGVQPVWLEIENRGKTPYFFIQRNMDPNYYSAEEAVYMAHYRQGKQFFEAGLVGILFFPLLALIPVNYFVIKNANRKMDNLFDNVSMHSYVAMPGKKLSGFLYTSVDQGTKHLKIDLLGDQSERKIFDFVVQVPGMKPDYTTKDFAARYPEETIKTCSDGDLPQYLETLPGWATNKKGRKNGDPLNLVVIGELEDLIEVFTSLQWNETSALTFSSGLSMAKAFFTGDNDRYSPVSPLYFHGHAHDIAFQKNRGNINQRLHFRLWYTPMRYNGKPVWLGAISRDIGVKFTFSTWYMTTHKIDPNLDDSRDYLLADLLEAQKVSQYGFYENAALKNSTRPKKNLTNDPYFTDNRRLVIEISKEDATLAAFPWNQPSV